MQIGAARVDITPGGLNILSPTPQGAYLSGFVLRSGAARGVLHPISARVMVARSAGRQVALVSLEVLELTPAHATSLRERVAQALGIEPGHICIACTHTHYAPAVFPLHECGEISPAYVAAMNDQVVRCAKAAAGNLAPARLVYGDASLAISGNRRAGVRGDRGGADGISPCDRAVRVLAALDENGTAMLTLFHHACHMVSLPPEDNRITGDIAGIASALLERAGDERAVAMYLTGCSGDINPLPQFKGAPEHAEAAATLMADAVRQALADARPLEDSEALEAELIEAHLPTAPPNPQWSARLATIEAALQKWQQEQAERQRPTWEARILRAERTFLENRLNEVRSGQYPTSITSRVQRLRIGALTLLAMSDEVMYEIGQDILASRPNDRIWPMAYANGGGGYICTPAAYREGGYEPVDSNFYYDRPMLTERSADALVAAAKSLIEPRA